MADSPVAFKTEAKVRWAEAEGGGRQPAKSTAAVDWKVVVRDSPALLVCGVKVSMRVRTVFPRPLTVYWAALG
jgi:hypothetical protein